MPQRPAPCYRENMSSTTPDRIDHTEYGKHTPGAGVERLQKAMGWERLPEMTPDERATFHAEMERADEEAHRFYGISAA